MHIFYDNEGRLSILFVFFFFFHMYACSFCRCRVLKIKSKEQGEFVAIQFETERAKRFGTG